MLLLMLFACCLLLLFVTPVPCHLPQCSVCGKLTRHDRAACEIPLCYASGCPMLHACTRWYLDQTSHYYAMLEGLLHSFCLGLLSMRTFASQEPSFLVNNFQQWRTWCCELYLRVVRCMDFGRVVVVVVIVVVVVVVVFVVVVVVCCLLMLLFMVLSL